MRFYEANREARRAKRSASYSLRYGKRRFARIDRDLPVKMRSTAVATPYSTPDIYTLCRLADIFDITLDELVEWSEE